MKDDFERGMLNLVKYADPDPEQLQLATMIIGRLYSLFDTDGNGAVDFVEMFSGLSILCGTDQVGRYKIIFRMHDYNRDGEITQLEIAQFLEGMYEVLNSVTDGGDGSTARVLAYKKMQEIFSKAMLTSAGGIGFEEFCRLYMHMASDGSSRRRPRH